MSESDHTYDADDADDAQTEATRRIGGLSRRGFVTAAVAVGATAGLGGTALAAQGDGPSAEATFDDQQSDGTSVTVDSVTMSEGGFVAIHDSRLNDGKVFESVIGVSESLDAGTHEDVEVTLFEGVPGADFEKSMLEADETLVAMPHMDSNDNDTYDFVASDGAEDGPYTADDKPVVDTAMVSVMAKPTADVCFPDQQSNGTSVTVTSATLSEGGFVAIHDARLNDGKVFESVIGVSESLDAGTHENVEVMLYDGVPGGEFDQDSLDGDQKLVAMPHMDSNDNDTYDFITSDGAEDGPYTADGKPVVNVATVTGDGC